MGGGRPVSGALVGNVPLSSGWSLQGVSDVDHDGISDIVWRHIDGTVGFWLMNGPESVREYPTTWLPADVSFAGVVELGPPRR